MPFPDLTELCLPSSYFDGDDPPEPQNIVKVPKIEPKEEKQENKDESGASVKEELNETDLEYLFQDVGRIPSLDEELKKDQKKKNDNARYLDMLVRQIFFLLILDTFANGLALLWHFLFQKFREKLPSYGMREVNITFCDCCLCINRVCMCMNGMF